MRNTFTFEFTELPLVIENGYEAALVNGSAEISYYPDGEWFVTRIFLDGFKDLPATDDRPRKMDRKPVELDEGTRIYQIINDRLENEWKHSVFAKVEDAITDDRASWADTRRDARREMERAY